MSSVNSSDNSVLRSLHDLGLGAWFGGSLMGAVGVNGAANDVRDSRDRTRVAAAGWARWTPVNVAAIGAHLVGAVGLLAANRNRVRHQSGVGTSSVVKTILTGAALGATAYSGALGAQVAHGAGEPADGGVKPNAATPDDIARAQQRLRVVQWVLPLLTGALTVVTAVQGEQQKPANQISGLVRNIEERVRSAA